MSWKQPIKPPTKVPTNVIKSSLCMSRTRQAAYLLVFLKSRLKTSLKCSESLLLQTKEWMKKKDKTICYIAEKHRPDVNTQVSYLLTCECVFKSHNSHYSSLFLFFFRNFSDFSRCPVDWSHTRISLLTPPTQNWKLLAVVSIYFGILQCACCIQAASYKLAATS